MKIYHNPRCRKSRETLALIEEKGISPEIILYLDNPPSKEELLEIIDMLDISAFELLRKNEKIYKEQYKGQTHSDEDWVEIMIKHPKLIERPIVIEDDQAIIGRPPENVIDLF